MGLAQYTYNRSTSGGEIIRELVNSTDGAGLHFDGAAGYISNTSSPDLGSKWSAELIIQADAWGSSDHHIVDWSTGERVIIASKTATDSGKLAFYRGGWVSFGVETLEDLKVHHLVIVVDETANTATLYDNGNQVASITPTGSYNVDDCTTLRLGADNNGTANFFEGTVYRARFWNKALSSTEVTTAYENATVPFADQYGSQTKVIDSDFTGNLDGWDAYNDWNSQTNPSNNMVLAASSSSQTCRTSTALTGGKRYRCTYSATSVTDAPSFAIWNPAVSITADVGSSTITNGTNSFEFVWPTGLSSDYFYIRANSATAAATLDDIFLWEIGCAVDLDLSFANPTQSLMVQDRAGAADGTASATGISQVTKIPQLNATAARIGTSAATPADGTVKIGDALTLSGPTTYGFVEGGSAGLILSNNSGNDCRILVNDDNTLQLNTSSATRLTIDSAGKAGLNQATPQARLHITESSVPALLLDGGSKDLAVATGASLQIGHWANGTSTFTDRLVINSAGLATFSNGIVETNGVLKENLLTNSGFDVWSNSTLENTGSDLITNGDFASSSDWSASTGAWVIGSGVATFTTGSGTSILSQGSLGTTSGKLYKLTFTVGTATATIAITNASASGTLVAEADYAVGAHTVVYEDVGNNDIAFTSSGGNSYTLDNVSLYEGVPGCVAADTLAFDGWHKTTSIDLFREQTEATTKDGSFYALKTTTSSTGQDVNWPSSAVKSLPDWCKRFQGRTVTFGAWVKTSTASHCRLRINDGAFTNSAYHTGGGAWEWLEVTDTVSATATIALFRFAFEITATDTYISQPMLVFGSAIGSGNYSRPSGEIVDLEKSVTVGANAALAAADDKILNLEALTDGKIPKGAKAVNLNIVTKNTSVTDYQGVSYGPTSGWDRAGSLQCLPIVDNKYQTASGVVNCDSNGDIYQEVSETGSTISYNGVAVTQVHLR